MRRQRADPGHRAGVDQDLGRVGAVELDVGEASIAAQRLLVGEEAVEAADDVVSSSGSSESALHMSGTPDVYRSAFHGYARVMSTESDQFTSTLSPEAVLDGFESLASERGWKLKERTADDAVAKKGVNVRTWSDQIRISAERLDDGSTSVHVVTHSRQIGDWGSNEDIAADIRARLSGADRSG